MIFKACKSIIKRMWEEKDFIQTSWYSLGVYNGKSWAIVFGWQDGFEEGEGEYNYHLCGKLAYCSTNSLMQEYDMDWLMPEDEEGIYDTEISFPNPTGENIEFFVTWILDIWDENKEKWTKIKS